MASGAPQKATPPFNPTLPDEIIVTDILPRLPAIDLGVWSCVSKLWYSTISDPKFVKQHLSRSIADNKSHAHKVLVSPINNGRRFDFISVPSLLTAADDDDLKPCDNLKIDYCSRKKRVEGSCNGLICVVSDKENVVILNPLTRKLRKLPSSGFRKRFGWKQKQPNYVCGFGYDAVNDDYKVVISYSFHCHADDEVEVFSMKDNNWTRINDSLNKLYLTDRGVYVSGALVWRGHPMSDDFTMINQKVVALNLASASYSFMSFPDSSRASFKQLGILEDCLCLFSHWIGPKECLDVWMMKEFGVQDSWTMMATIPFKLDSRISSALYRPFLYKSDGVLIIMQSGEFIIYNLHDGTFTMRAVHKPDPCRLVFPILFVESLVSPVLVTDHQI